MTNEHWRRSIGVGAVALILTGVTGCMEIADGENTPPRPDAQSPSAMPPPMSEPTAAGPADPPRRGTTPEPTPDLASSPAATSSPTTPSPINPSPTTSPIQRLPSAEQPVTIRAARIEHRRVRGALFAVQRNGRTAVVNLMITKVDPADPPFRLRTLLNDGDTTVAARNRSAVDGLRLIDGNAGKLYLPATTRDGTCLCSPASNSVFDHYDELMVSVVFAAPPPTVKFVDVLMPLFGTVSNVPVE